MKRIIVNADDYGRAASVSAGIRQAHREGIVTSTTVMMNMPGVEAELRTALADCPQLGLGVHLTLTAGSPLLPPEQIPSMAAPSGGGVFPKLAALVSGLATVKPAEVKAEWRAQIESFVRVAGSPPTHLDSHHHTSYLTPELFGAMLDLAREYGCAIRLPLPHGPVDPDLLDGSEAFFMQRLQQFAPALLTASGVPHPDNFEVRFYGERATPEMLREIIRTLPEGVTELMCHPGLPDPQLAEISSYNEQRAAELTVLTDPAVREQRQRAGVELISFRSLR